MGNDDDCNVMMMGGGAPCLLLSSPFMRTKFEFTTSLGPGSPSLWFLMGTRNSSVGVYDQSASCFGMFGDPAFEFYMSSTSCVVFIFFPLLLASSSPFRSNFQFLPVPFPGYLVDPLLRTC